MAEGSLVQESTNQPDPPANSSSSSSSTVLFPRRIVFHPAKKPFKGFSTDFHLETLNPSTSEPRAAGSSATSPAASKKHDGLELSEYGLDPELSFGITFRRIGAGLRNLGNTCFLNSVIQCLTYTEPLAAYLQSGKHKNSCRVAGFCALCAIQNHVSRALQATGRILSPEDLVGNLRCISRNFRNARQEDAHEYMVNLLESMHKCCLPSGVPSESPGAYEKSLVHKIFGGRLRSQVKCQQCSYSSNKFDPFLDLSLEIFKADSLHKALANFTAAEWLDGGERQYNCQRCKQKVRALKQLTIHKAPYVLTIHLKRFHAHDPGQKIKKKVQFGCTLDLKSFVSSSHDEDVKYSLYGVLVHSGSSTHSGHYYCYVRTSNNMWYTLDDNRVSHVSEREVLNQQAYMLFYVRDRKTIVPRKPVDIAKKENVKVNVNVNGGKDSATSNQVLKEVSNGLAEKKTCSESCLTSEAQKNMINVDSSRVLSVRDGLVKQKNFSLAESLIQNKIPVSEPSSKQQQQQEDSRDGLSVANSDRECLSSCNPSEKEHILPNNGKNLVSSSGNNNVESKVSLEVPKESISSVAAFNNPETSTVEHNSDGASQSQENNIVLKVDAAAPQQDSKSRFSNAASPKTSLNQPTNDNHQVGFSATCSVHGEGCSIVHENVGCCEDVALNKSVNRSLTKESLQQKKMKRMKKKVLKYQISGMFLPSSFLFRGYLNLRKRKSHKRIKHSKLDMKTQNNEKINMYDFLSDIGPSTSGKSDVFTSASISFENGTTGDGSRPGANAKSNGEYRKENSAKGDFKKRIDQNCAVLATAMQVENTLSCGSVTNQFEARQGPSLHDGNRDQMHNNLMSMLTVGLEETVVARWDDIELPTSQFLESKNDNTCTIGYVGDDWDEEYDKGKRKKLRGFQHSYDGPNLFQEVATKKSKLKRAKLDRSSSGNSPFRI